MTDNIKLRKVSSWSEAKETFKAINQERLNLQTEHNPLSSSKFLFRGHGDSAWKLSTTLERTVEKPVLLTSYYRHVSKTLPQVEAFSDTKWELWDLKKYTEWVNEHDDLHWGDFPGYDYMVYLRHHGFPSPLLDWSASPYVAAYFAFRDPPTEAENVAIYCYLETSGAGKSWRGGQPLISVRGPYVRSHRRHFLQQCQYTVCSKSDETGHHYESHENVFKLAEPTQDLLWKIVIPVTAVPEALTDLDLMNINALSLMGSEDSLAETMANREYRMN